MPLVQRPDSKVGWGLWRAGSGGVDGLMARDHQHHWETRGGESENQLTLWQLACGEVELLTASPGYFRFCPNCGLELIEEYDD